MSDHENEAAKLGAAGQAARDAAAEANAETTADDAQNGKKVTLESLEGVDEATQQTLAALSEAAEQRIAELESRVAELEEQKLRLAADVQNTVRRADRDKRDAETYGGTKLARDLLAVYDNLEAAVAQASEDLRKREAAFFNGVDLTRKELLNAFAKHKITIVQPEAGDKFDPNMHQAMYEAPVPGATPGSVIQVMQSGFMIAERLLRPAMVGVASAASAAAPAESAPAAEADASADTE